MGRVSQGTHRLSRVGSETGGCLACSDEERITEIRPVGMRPQLLELDCIREGNKVICVALRGRHGCGELMSDSSLLWKLGVSLSKQETHLAC